MSELQAKRTPSERLRARDAAQRCVSGVGLYIAVLECAAAAVVPGGGARMPALG